jgi:hypothetical protein
MAWSSARRRKPSRLGWPGSVIGTPRRGMVDRRTATLLYAGRNRGSAPRRKVPLTKHAPAWPSQRTHGGIGPAATVPGAAYGWRSPAPGQQVTDGREHVRPPSRPKEPGELPGDRGDDHVLGVLGGGQTTKRPPSRSWAAQARATTWGSRPAGGCAGRPRPRAGAGRPRPTRPAGCPSARCHTW